MVELFVPGRLCLFGEHSDWAGALRRDDLRIAAGTCILTGTDQGIFATVSSTADFEVVASLPDGTRSGPLTVPMNGAALDAATRARHFLSYAVGVAAEVWKTYRTPGVRIEVPRTTLPIGRGLSSSAAICVLTARAFNQIHHLQLDLEQEMELAYRGELAAGSQCGRMDQACAYGQRVIQMDFDGETPTVQQLAVGGPLYLLIVDLLHNKDTRRILADLNAVFRATDDPRNGPLRAALGHENRVVVGQARAALAQGNATALGELMSAAQRLFDRAVAPACSAELAAPRLHALLSDAPVRALTWGGKGVGSQGDGAAQLVCRDAEAQAALERSLNARRTVHCLPLTIA